MTIPVLDEVCASIDMNINTAERLFLAAAVASASDLYATSDDSAAISSVTSLWSALARSSSVTALAPDAT